MNKPQRDSKYCYNCSEEIDVSISFCPECGVEHEKSDEVNKPEKRESDPTVTLLGYQFPTVLAYHLIWIGPVFVITSALSRWGSVFIIGYLMSVIGVWVDAKYATKLSDNWDPNKQSYVIGILLAMIIAVPVYLNRRRKYV